MSDQTPGIITEESYFEKRMQLLGVSAAENRIGIKRTDINTGEGIIEEMPVFSESKKYKGIDILVYTLDRLLINYKADGKRWSDNYYITRLEVPKERKDGSTQKYNIPKGQGTHPFFHPWLIELFEKKQEIKTLYLVEGFFKAFKGCMCGIPVIGLSSITHMKDKDNKELHEDIKRLMLTCKVQRMVWLVDGDCLDITSKDLKDGIDLYRRPKGFFNSCDTFKTLLDQYEHIEKWFVHIDIDNILQQNLSPGLGGLSRDQVKGLDDLLCTFPDKIPQIVDDLQNVSKPGEYFVKFNISYGVGKVQKHFHLYNVNEFYLFHVERRKELKGVEFKFNGTTYKYDEQSGECKIVSPGEAKNYCRVGDQYYEFVWVPNKYGQLEKRLESRQRSTIVEDHGKDFVKHIAKFKSFCNVPSHVNFQPVVNNCFNVYSQFEWEAEEQETTEMDFPYIMNFLKHVFGQHDVSFIHPKDKRKIKYNNYDLGLDYIQLLLQKPEEKLPILCLVSKENNTGKSTFADFLKILFTGNVAIVGNADISGDFNRHWATKLVVVCDEAKIDKQVVVEKVKSLSTAERIMMNSKGKDHVELECFIKFIFITNNEDNFINLTDDDIRFWVLKVPRISEVVTDLKQLMKDEIPAFLSFLSRRKKVTERLNRMWFHPSLLRTEAFKKVVAHSQTTIVKELRQYFRDLFRDFGVTEVMMTKVAIHEDALRKRYEINYLERAIEQELKAEQYHIFVYKENHYKTWELAVDAVKKDIQDPTEMDLIRLIQKKYVTKRFDYPKWEWKIKDGKLEERVMVWKKDNGRPYIFCREMFLTAEEIAMIEVDPEIKQLLPDDPGTGDQGAGDQTAPAAGAMLDELPF